MRKISPKELRKIISEITLILSLYELFGITAPVRALIHDYMGQLV